MVKGSCACGQISFEVSGSLRDVINCHCGTCRKTSGHFWAASSAPIDDIHLINDATLTWFQSSDTARRGFCNACGASLFFEPAGEGRWAIGAGCLDAPTGLKTLRDIYTDEAGDYHVIPEAR